MSDTALIRMRMPKGTGGFCYQGMPFDVEDGCVRVPAVVAAHLRESFGAEVVPDIDPVKPSSKKP